MSLLALLAALAWSHYRPLAEANPITRELQRYAAWLGEHFNGGHSYHGFLAWGLGALLPAILVGVIGLSLGAAGNVFKWAWAVLVLYACFGFRSVGLEVAAIVAALRSGDVETARARLKAWRGGSVEAFGGGDIARAAIEEALRAGLYRLLGVVFWFVLLGPMGAVLYRVSRLMRDYWQAHVPERGDFLTHVDQVLFMLDWLPVRLAAFSFAVVGNFQGALDAWRNQAWLWHERNEGVLLAAGAGALGVRLGGGLPLPVGLVERTELGTGEAADADYLEGALALLWRALLFLALALLLLKLGEIGG